MTKECQICQKESRKAGKWVKLRGKYNPGGERKQKPNFHWLNLNGQRLRVCARCLKKYSSDK